MVLFKDMNKASGDLLAKDFVHSRRWDVDFKHFAKNTSFIQNANINEVGTCDAQSTAKYSCETGFIEAKVGTSATVLEAQYNVPGVPGLTVGSKFDRSFQKMGVSDMVDLSSEYATKNGTHCRLGVNPFLASWSASAVTSIFQKEAGKVLVGGEIAGNADIRKLKYAIGASYVEASKDLSYIASIQATQHNGSHLGKITGNIYARSSKLGASEYSAEVSHILSSSKTSLAFGGLWFVDRLDLPKQDRSGSNSYGYTTFIKAKMTHDSQISTSLTHKFSDLLTASIGAQIDLSKGLQSQESIRYGIKLNVQA